MKRFLKITGKTLLWIIGIILLLAVVFSFLIQTPRVQTWATKKVGNYLEEELKTTISIGKVDIEYPLKFVLMDVNIQDLQGNELVNVGVLRLSDYSNDEDGRIQFGELELERPHFFLKKYENDTVYNHQFIVDYFAKNEKDTVDKSLPIITCDQLSINDGIFSFDNLNFPDTLRDVVDYKHLILDSINFSADQIFVHGDSVCANISNLGFNEKSGFKASNISGLFVMNDKKMALNNANIITNQTDLKGDLSVKYKRFTDFKKFNSKVKMNFILTESVVNFSDISYFSKSLKGIDKTVTISGLISGKVNNLKGKKLHIVIDENTMFDGSVAMNGLPTFDETFITLNINNLSTSKEALNRIPIPPFESGKTIQLPDNFSDLGRLRFKGNFTGFISDFVAYGTLNTALGVIKSDISLKEKPDGYKYKGHLSSIDFDLGEFYNIPKIGKVSSSLTIAGQGLALDEINANVEGEVQSFYFNDYNYQNIVVDGNLKESFFDGELSILDDNLDLDFKGKVDMTTKVPEYSFVADVRNIDFVDLNFFDFEEYASLTTRISSNAKGNSFDNLVGDILLEDVSYCVLDKELNIDTLFLHSEKTDDIRIMELSSNLVSGQLKGKYDFRNLKHSMELILAEIIPSYDIMKNEKHKEQDFSLHLDIHDFSLVQDFFVEKIFISKETRFDMEVNELENDFSLITTADSVNLYGVSLLGVTLDTRRQDSAIYFTLMNDDIFPSNNSVHFKEFSLDGRTEGDTLFTALEWNTEEDRHRGEMSGRYVIRGARNIDYYFDQSYISVNDDVWQFNESASINIDSTEVEINDFNLYHKDEYLIVSGNLSDNPEKSLDITFKNIALENVNPFFNKSALKVYGNLDGTASIKDIYKEKLIISDIDVLAFHLNEYLVGDLELSSEWDNVYQRIVSNGKLFKNNTKPIFFDGFYTPKDKKSPMDINLNISHLELGFLNEIIPSVISDIGGAVSGSATIKGKPQKPIMNGSLFFEDASVHVDYLNTTYQIKEKVGVYYDMFTLDNIQVLDQEGNEGFLVGTILHSNFKEWNFDLFLDVEDSKFLCLDTDEDDNSLYYGKAYGSGFVGVSGEAENLEFDINLISERGTKIALPLGSSEDVAFEDFVTFIDRTAENAVEEQIDLNGISLKFDLEITPETEFEIIFDEAIGDVMHGTGSGNINMLIDTRGKFEMFGNYKLLRGSYLFTLQNLIAKDFKVESGGTIQWYGDPLGANIDISAVYRLSAPLYDLLGASNENYKTRTQVDLAMNLSGDLLKPVIGFDIDLPNVDDFTKSRVQSILNSDEEKSRQAFGLIVLRRFLPPPDITIESNSTNGVIAKNTSEFFSSQISNWLSQISDDFDLGFNYSPGDEITNQEIALALSTQLFNDRLSLSGNFGVSNGNDANNNPTSLIGDLRIEYKLLEDGRVRMVVYNKSNDFEIASTNQNASTQGVGAIYQEDFETLDEFYCGFKNLFRRKDMQVECP